MYAESALFCMYLVLSNMTIAAIAGADPSASRNCIKTDPQSGQAWRGKHCAPAVVRSRKNFCLSAS